MVPRQFKLFFVFLFAFFLLLGAGCKSKVPPQEIAGQPEQRMEQSRVDAGTVQGQKGESEPEARADSGPSKPDAGADASVIPEGWEVYRGEEGGYRIAYPPGWKVTEDGGLYKDAPNLEQLLEDSQGHFESVAQVAPASIGVAVFDPEGSTVDELWEEGGAGGGDIDQKMTIDGEYARLGICTGIRYMECISVIHQGLAYSIGMYDQGLVVGDPETKIEIEQIINTFNFLP